MYRQGGSILVFYYTFNIEYYKILILLFISIFPARHDRPGPVSSTGYFGEISILDGLPRSAAVRASGDSVLFRVPRDAFEELLAKNDLVAYKLLYHMAMLLAERQRTTTETLSGLLEEEQVGAVHDGIRQIVGEHAVRE